MMRPLLALVIVFAVPGTAAAQAQQREVIGDTLLVERVQVEPHTLPARGLTMAEVEARYGAPVQRLEPRGGQKRDWPTIHRWVYPGYTVYFERTRVLDVVLNQAGAGEIGPKPPIP